MKLKEYEVQELRGTWDSDRMEVGDVTCLVGRKDGGKAALLKALYRPINHRRTI